MDNNKIVDAIMDCKFDCNAQVRENENAERQDRLTDLKIKIQKKYVDLNAECEQIEQDLLMLERVQEGRNKAQREALLEVAKVEEGYQDKFNKLRDLKYYLACISEVKEHNKMIIDLMNLDL